MNHTYLSCRNLFYRSTIANLRKLSYQSSIHRTLKPTFHMGYNNIHNCKGSTSTKHEAEMNRVNNKKKKENNEKKAINKKKRRKVSSLSKAMDVFANGSLITPAPSSMSPNRSVRVREKQKKPPPHLNTDFQVFCSCLPGLEPYLYNELLTLGIQPTSARPKSKLNFEGVRGDGRVGRRDHMRGGVAFTTRSLTQILSCHLYLGTASHVLLRATPKPFQARGMEELYRKVSKLSFWEDYICPYNRDDDGVIVLPKLDIRVTSSKSRLFHTTGIAERVERGIWDALGFAVDEPTMKTTARGKDICDEDENVIKVLVRVHKDQVEISIDTSTTPLHKRGYRLESGKAPMREDLAYSLLYSAGWGQHSIAKNHTSKYCSTINSDDNDGDCHSPRHSIIPSVGLIDPFCGSGTIIIEGVSMLYGLPPGRLRPPPFICSRLHMENPQAWNEMVNAAMDRARDFIQKFEEKDNSASNDGGKMARALVFGSDRDAGVIDTASQNAKRAGVSNLIYLEQCAISSNRWLKEPTLLAPKDFVLVATNPPYGHRLTTSGSIKNAEKKHNALIPLYQTLGHKFKRILAFCNGTEKGSINGGDKKRDAQLAIIANDPKLARKTGVIDLNAQFTTKHGGLNVCALTTVHINSNNKTFSC